MLLVRSGRGATGLTEIPQCASSRLEGDCVRAVDGTVDQNEMRALGDKENVTSADRNVCGGVSPAFHVSGDMDHEPPGGRSSLQGLQRGAPLTYRLRRCFQDRLLLMDVIDQFGPVLLLQLSNLLALQDCSVGIGIAGEAARTR